MKKTLNILFTIIILLVLIVLLNKHRIIETESKTLYKNTIKELFVSKAQSCDYKPKLYYEFNKRKIYTYCVDSVMVVENDNALELKDYLKNHSFNNILNFLEKKSFLWDGGTEEYKDRESKKISLINCHTLKGNRDIYIGDEKMRFKANFCKDYNETFTKIYTIDKIENYKVQQYEDGIPVSYGKSLKITLKSTSGKKTTVILNNIFDDLKINKTYEFEFELNSEDDLYENILDKDIFKNYNIVEIREIKK